MDSSKKGAGKVTTGPKNFKIVFVSVDCDVVVWTNDSWNDDNFSNGVFEKQW